MKQLKLKIMEVKKQWITPEVTEIEINSSTGPLDDLTAKQS